MEEETTSPQDKQTIEEQEKVKYVYTELHEMLEVSTESYTEFNDRTLTNFLNDCQKRANSYLPDRESLNKADWQANYFSKTTRNKVKAQIAGIAKNPPEVSVSALNDRNRASVLRGEIMKTTVDASFVIGENNPQMDMYFDSWNCSINGTVIKYDGYLRVEDDVKVITSYDPQTGEVEFDTEKQLIEDECIEIDVPLENFLIKDPYIRDVQKQSAVAWIEYIDKDQLAYEYSDYKNFDLVKSGKELLGSEAIQLFFKKQWDTRVDDDKYEVVKYYRKHGKDGDMQRVVINGVLMEDTPLMLGKKKKKYPFSKTIFEPFAKAEFFWGNSLPNILMGEQDVENALVNAMTDESYRSVTTPMLIGMENKDNFDLEDEYVDGDTRIYVNDVNQVKPMPVKGVTQGDIAMLQIIKQGQEDDSTDKVQGGASGSGSTAREIVIANERAEELKGLFYIMMTDLWLQKYRLRGMNILMNYGVAKVEAFVGEDGKEFEALFRSYRLPAVELSNGKIGTKQIDVVGGMKELSRPFDLTLREEQARQDGEELEILEITPDALDDYEYVFRIEPEGVYQKSKALKMAMVEEKMRGYASLFPQKFQENQNEFFKIYAEAYGDDPEQFDGGGGMQQDPMAMMGGGAEPTGQAGPVPETAPMGELQGIGNL